MNDCLKFSKTTKLKWLFIVFFVFFVISFLTPISGDDYGNYVNTYGDVLKSFQGAIGFYNSWEGRFIGRIIILIFTYHKMFWNIVTPCLITGIFASCLCIIDKCKNKNLYIILLLSLLLLNSSMFAQCYTWLAGSITYLYPSAIFIIYFTYLYHKVGIKFNLIELIVIMIINIIGTMFVENIGCSLVFGNILFLIYSYFKDKSKFIPLLLATILSIISLLIMLKSPGSAIRSAANIEFNSLNIFEKIYFNISNINSYFFARNPIMIILMLVVINYCIYTNKFKYKLLLYIASNLIPIASIFQNIRFLSFIDITFLNFNIPKYLDVTSKGYIVYWLLFLVMFLYSIYHILKLKKKKMLYVYFFVFSSMISSLVMMILSTWGDRVTFLSTISIIISSIVVINEFIPNNKVFNNIIKISGIIVISVYLICFVYVYKINYVRENYIYKQVNEGKTEVKVLENPIKLIWNNNLPGDYFVKTYRQYLGIDEAITFKVYKLRYREYFIMLFRN